MKTDTNPLDFERKQRRKFSQNFSEAKTPDKEQDISFHLRNTHWWNLEIEDFAKLAPIAKKYSKVNDPIDLSNEEENIVKYCYNLSVKRPVQAEKYRQED